MPNIPKYSARFLPSRNEMDDSDIAAAMEAIGGTNETLGAIDGAHEIGCLCCNTALEEMTGETEV
eukprot:873822-Amorphochlora_amoeboformis.AAC.2